MCDNRDFSLPSFVTCTLVLASQPFSVSLVNITSSNTFLDHLVTNSSIYVVSSADDSDADNSDADNRWEKPTTSGAKNDERWYFEQGDSKKANSTGSAHSEVCFVKSARHHHPPPTTMSQCESFAASHFPGIQKCED
eukprot:636838-Prorocentrum_minimum.AAC.3